MEGSRNVGRRKEEVRQRCRGAVNINFLGRPGPSSTPQVLTLEKSPPKKQQTILEEETKLNPGTIDPKACNAQQSRRSELPAVGRPCASSARPGNDRKQAFLSVFACSFALVVLLLSSRLCLAITIAACVEAVLFFLITKGALRIRIGFCVPLYYS